MYKKNLRTGQIVRPVPANYIPEEIREILKARGADSLSRNSTCPCGSGKRFKACHMVVPGKEKR